MLQLIEEEKCRKLYISLQPRFSSMNGFLQATIFWYFLTIETYLRKHFPAPVHFMIHNHFQNQFQLNKDLQSDNARKSCTSQLLGSRDGSTDSWGCKYFLWNFLSENIWHCLMIVISSWTAARLKFRDDYRLKMQLKWVNKWIEWRFSYLQM